MAQAFYDAALADRLVVDRRRDARAGRPRVRADAGQARGRPGLGVRAAARAGRARHAAARRASAPATRATSPISGSSSCSTCRSTTPIQLAAQLDDPRLAPAARFATQLAEAEAAPTRAPAHRDDPGGERRAGAARPAVDDRRRAAQAGRRAQVGLSASSTTRRRSRPSTTGARTGRSGLGLSAADLDRRPHQGRADHRPRRRRRAQGPAVADQGAGRPRRRQRPRRARAPRAPSGRPAPARFSRRRAPTRSPSCAIREGLSTQLELSDSRLLLAQAQVNRARRGARSAVGARALRAAAQLPLGVGRRWRRRGGDGRGRAGQRTANATASTGAAQAPATGATATPAATGTSGSTTVRRTASSITGSIARLASALALAACGATPRSEAAAAEGAAPPIEIGRENVVEVDVGGDQRRPARLGRAEGRARGHGPRRDRRRHPAGRARARASGRRGARCWRASKARHASRTPSRRRSRSCARPSRRAEWAQKRSGAHREPGQGRRARRARRSRWRATPRRGQGRRSTT